MVVATGTMMPNPSTCPSSTAPTISSSPESMNVHHRRIRPEPPARKRSSTSDVGRRRMSGYSKRLPSRAKFALNQSGATMSTTPAAVSTLTQQV